MPVRIIDNKKVEMTHEEWTMYEAICASYDQPPHTRGKDLFQGLFESDDNGIITCLVPPKRQTSFEIISFIFSLMQNQHLRIMDKAVQTTLANLTKKVDDKLTELTTAATKKKSK